MDQNNELIDLQRLLRILLVRSWLIVAGLVIGAAAASFYSTESLPTYRASTTILVQQSGSSLIPSAGDMQAGQRIATTYMRLITTRPVLERAAEILGDDITASQLKGAISVNVIPNTQLLVVAATRSDPESAAKVANATAAAFINKNDEDRLLALARTQQAAAAQGLTDLSRLLADQFAATQTLRVIETAIPPSSPLPTSGKRGVMVAGGLLGLIAAVGGILVIEYFADALPSVDRIERKFGIDVVAVVGQWTSKDTGERDLVFRHAPRSQYAESYNGLAANIKFASKDRNNSVLLVTSGLQNEGKTSTAANLALALSERGEAVALVDADLRKPQVSEYLAWDESQVGKIGLTDHLLKGDISPQAFEGAQNDNPENVIVPVQIVPAGPIAGNPTRLLTSPNMGTIIEKLRQRFTYVIIDSPPVLAVADAISLASHVDAVLIVVNPNVTKSRQLTTTVRHISRTGAPILGIILNRVKSWNSTYGGYYGGGYYTEQFEHSVNGASSWYHKPGAAARNVRDRILRRS